MLPESEDLFKKARFYIAASSTPKGYIALHSKSIIIHILLAIALVGLGFYADYRLHDHTKSLDKKTELSVHIPTKPYNQP